MIEKHDKACTHNSIKQKMFDIGKKSTMCKVTNEPEYPKHENSKEVEQSVDI